MITPTEVQKIVDQININFADDRKRLKGLEEQFQTITETVKGLQDIAHKQPTTRKTATKEATQ